MNGIKGRPEMKFFTNEAPETKSKNLFASAFIQIWTVEGMFANSNRQNTIK